MSHSFIISKHHIIFAATFLLIATFCCKSEYTNENPAQVFSKTLFCFNDKFIYRGCGQDYRLTENGLLHIPREQTDQYCSGPCYAETNLVLNCIDNILSSFLFYNSATVNDIRSTLRTGCSYTRQRGNFNVAGNYYESSYAYRSAANHPINFYLYIVIFSFIGFELS